MVITGGGNRGGFMRIDVCGCRVKSSKGSEERGGDVGVEVGYGYWIGGKCAW